MKKLFVTGLSSDVAMAYLKRLDARGEKLEVWGTCHTNGEMLRDTMKKLQSVNAHALSCDLSDEEQLLELADWLKKERVPFDGYLHCASSHIIYKRFKDFDWEATKRAMDVKIGVFAAICRVLAPVMAKNEGGRIAAVASSCCFGAPPDHMADYVITNHALVGLVKVLAKEYGKKGVCINAISPGMIKTKFLNNIDERQVEIIAEKTELGRTVSLDEVSAGIDYLLSAEASCINGINLNLSGGEYM